MTLCLEHDIDISRGDMMVGVENLPGRSADLHAQVCWMHSRPLQPGKKYFLKHATQTVQAVVTRLESRVNMTTLEPEPDPAALAINDIGGIRIKTARPLVFDGYATNHLTGCLHFDRAGHERHRRRRNVVPAHRSREAGIYRLCDLKNCS